VTPRNALLNETSLLKNDMVAIIVNRDLPVTWTAPRALLRQVSGYFEHEISDPSVTSLSCLAIWNEAFKLFLEWSFFKKYAEYARYAPDFDNSDKYYSLEKEPRASAENMSWCAKAAYMAHELGGHLDAPAFQDYAMQRLHRAYSVNPPRAIVTPLMFQTVKWADSKLRVFLEDCVIRNWGDDAVVDHELAEWSQELGTSERFRGKFARAMGLSLEKRQQEPMALGQYLGKMDEEETICNRYARISLWHIL